MTTALNETQPNEEEVAVFEPNTPADDELVVTDSKAAETDVKKAVNIIDAAEGKDPKYEIPAESEDPNVAIMQKLRGISEGETINKVASDGSTASYYELPAGAEQLQDLISYRNMNAQLGEIFRECYRYGQASHCDELRGAKKIKFYIDAEIARLEKLVK